MEELFVVLVSQKFVYTPTPKPKSYYSEDSKIDRVKSRYPESKWIRHNYIPHRRNNFNTPKGTEMLCLKYSFFQVGRLTLRHSMLKSRLHWKYLAKCEYVSPMCLLYQPT